MTTLIWTAFNLFFMIHFWNQASTDKQWSFLWWFNMFISALNGVAVFLMIKG